MELTRKMVDKVGSIHPWALMVSIVFYIYVGFFFLAALAMFASGFALGRGGLPGMLVVAVFYGGLALLYFFPATKAWSFARACRDFGGLGSVEDLIRAQEMHHRFWRVAGVCAIVYLGLMVLALGAAGFFFFSIANGFRSI